MRKLRTLAFVRN